MKRICKFYCNREGFTELIGSIFALLFLITFLSGAITIFGELSKIEDIKKISQQMAREISLTGKVDGTTQARLARLESSFGLDVDMVVEGQYIAATQKLKTESDFTVIIRCKSKYGLGGIVNQNKEKLYTAKSHGKVEEYHKTTE